MSMFTELSQEVTAKPNTKTIGWFIKASYFGYTPTFDASVTQVVSEGAWDTLLNRIAEVAATESKDTKYADSVLRNVSLEVTSVVISSRYYQEKVVDAELDALLASADQGEELAPLLNGKGKVAENVFCYINMEISSPHVDGGTVATSIKVFDNASAKTLSKLLAQSKLAKPTLEPLISSVNDPRVKKVFVCKPLNF